MSENKWLIDPEISDVSVSEILEGITPLQGQKDGRKKKIEKLTKIVLLGGFKIPFSLFFFFLKIKLQEREKIM